MNRIKEVANLLGVELNEQFVVYLTPLATQLGYKPNNNIYQFDSRLVVKGHDDSWYGGQAQMLEYLILGIYQINKGER